MPQFPHLSNGDINSTNLIKTLTRNTRVTVGFSQAHGSTHSMRCYYYNHHQCDHWKALIILQAANFKVLVVNVENWGKVANSMSSLLGIYHLYHRRPFQKVLPRVWRQERGIRNDTRRWSETVRAEDGATGTACALGWRRRSHGVGSTLLTSGSKSAPKWESLWAGNTFSGASRQPGNQCHFIVRQMYMMS